jgi:ABC-type branched-subunit amino acid transport system substrate-binding protein
MNGPLIGGSTAYFDIVNKAGGVYGRKINIVVKFDNYDPEIAVQNTYDFITKDRVFALFDYVGTPNFIRVLPLLQYFQAEHVVTIAPFTGSGPPRQPPYDRYTFNVRPSYRDEENALVKYLYAKGYRRFGLLRQSDTLGMAGELAAREALAALGLRLAGNATYRRGAAVEADMREQVQILREREVEAVLSVSVAGASEAFIRDARRAGWNVPIANLSIVQVETTLENLRRNSPPGGPDLTRNLIGSEVVPGPEDTRYPLVREYRAHVPRSEWSFMSLEGWLNAVVFTEGLRRAGPNPTRKRFIAAMEGLHGWDPGLEAELGYSSTDHEGLHRVWLLRTEKGKWVPEEMPRKP